MTRELVFVALLGLALTSPGQAGIYTIDGSLSDWGVTPFSDWVPDSLAEYIETDNVNAYGAATYDEGYDVEAMYFNSDATNFYFGIVTSYGVASSDLGLDLNEDMAVSAHGVVTGLEYAVHLGGGDIGTVVVNPTWSLTTVAEWSDGWQGSPYQATGGTPVGAAALAIQEYLGLEAGDYPDTHVIEASVPRNIFPENGGGDGDLVGIHYTIWCGNDSINLIGHLGSTPVPPPDPIPTPLPGATILCSLGMLSSSLGFRLAGRRRGHRKLT